MQGHHLFLGIMMQRHLKNAARKAMQLALGSPHPKRPMLNWYQYYFFRYKRARFRLRPGSLTTFRPPFVPGLVSIVLPVYNGENHLEEAIKSIISQTYEQFELIIVNDGSTDSSPAIMERFAKLDSRIRVIHQANQKLPKSLSNGFRIARGEFLTWTSDDNRLKPSCIERMVDCLTRHPDWDMVYANMDIIGEDGRPLENSEWYSNYQVPPGSQHVHLPEDTLELNVWPNQYIGAAFLYRARVAALLRDYSPYRFTIEDYDYFMQINEFFEIRHADFKETVYEYRFHGSSLTSREKELQILKQREFLMVFDDFRRDFSLGPMQWIVDASPAHGEISSSLEQLACKAGDLFTPAKNWNQKDIPSLWFPCCYVRITEDVTEADSAPAPELPSGSTSVLVYTGEEPLPKVVKGGWDLCITTVHDKPVPTAIPYQGWHFAEDTADIFLASEILCKTMQFQAIEREIFEPPRSALKYSVVICTYKRNQVLEKAITSVVKQDFPSDEFEVVVVNNHPDSDLSPLIERIKERTGIDQGPVVRQIICPFKGLSHARNAGISESQGEVVCFLDDDAVAEPNWLREIDLAYSEEPKAGLVGGKIIVQVPEPRPKWLADKGLVYWSHFDPPFKDVTWTDKWWEFPWGANWTAKRHALLAIGGFRTRYGRKGNDFGGGEELLAGCLIHRLGWKVGINPRAKVLHMIEPSRFTKRHVKNTIRSALLVNYRLQTDLYMPRWMNAAEAARKTGSWTRDLLRYFLMSPFDRLQLTSNIAAHIALMKLIAQDYRNRLKAREK